MSEPESKIYKALCFWPGKYEFPDLSAFSSSNSDLLASICFRATSDCF